MSVSAIFIIFGLLSVSPGSLDTQARLRFYFSSFDDYEEIPLSEVQDIYLAPWYNSSRSTVIFTHGYTGDPNGNAVRHVVGTYLEQDESNVALLNWEHLAAVVTPGFSSSYIKWAVPNSLQLGMEFADILANLSSKGLDLNRTHLIGHSVGAHLFGITGNHLAQKGIQLPWITGLDPSGIGFENKPDVLKLNRGSAAFVSVIHTDPSKYGIRFAIGTVDIWPNYRTAKHVTQPGCESRRNQMFSSGGWQYNGDHILPRDKHAHLLLHLKILSPVFKKRTWLTNEAALCKGRYYLCAPDLCNHNRSWQLLIDAIKFPGTLYGTYAKNYRQWKKKPKDVEILHEIGTYDLSAPPGNYYLKTKSESPFGLGMDGLFEDRKAR